ncbi:hypothetical protein KM043_000297 [Ampulex compressa]|nr:hypothetical protein KM043_000297 [Ampulex compressa]
MARVRILSGRRLAGAEILGTIRPRRSGRKGSSLLFGAKTYTYGASSSRAEEILGGNFSNLAQPMKWSAGPLMEDGEDRSHGDSSRKGGSREVAEERGTGRLGGSPSATRRRSLLSAHRSARRWPGRRLSIRPPGPTPSSRFSLEIKVPQQAGRREQGDESAWEGKRSREGHAVRARREYSRPESQSGIVGAEARRRWRPRGVPSALERRRKRRRRRRRRKRRKGGERWGGKRLGRAGSAVIGRPYSGRCSLAGASYELSRFSTLPTAISPRSRRLSPSSGSLRGSRTDASRLPVFAGKRRTREAGAKDATNRSKRSNQERR